MKDKHSGVAGVLLAAGSGSRLGRPKAFVHLGERTLVERGISTLAGAGCDPVVVVLGAAVPSGATSRLSSLPERPHVVVNPDWAEGISTSLRVGLAASAGSDAAVVALVDQPGISTALIGRLVDRWRRGGSAAVVASYGGSPRNPVVLSASVWPEVIASASGDAGARSWLRANPGRVVQVECADLGGEGDIDTPDQLAAAEAAWSIRDESGQAPMSSNPRKEDDFDG
jgi:CTP:molybdopterin cytidylyltransferase MocA